MTEVFVWKNYGEVSVYALSTKEQQENLLEEVFDAVRFNAQDSDEVDRIEAIKNSPTFSVKKKINWLLEITQVGDDNDFFEYGTGFHGVKQ